MTTQTITQTIDEIIDEIIQTIGKPDSARTEFVINRIPQAAIAQNCAASALCLLGSEESGPKYAPLTWLANNHSYLVFFLDGGGYIKCEAKNLANPYSYSSESNSFSYFRVKLGGKEFDTWELHQLSKRDRYQGLIIDPFIQNDFFKRLDYLLSDEKIVVAVSYNFDADLRGDGFHCATIIKNSSRSHLLSKDHYGPLKIEPLSRGGITYNLEGMHFLAIGGKNLPLL